MGLIKHLRSILRHFVPRDIRVAVRDRLGIPRWLNDDYAPLRVIPPGLPKHLVLDVGACEGWFTTCWLHYNPKAQVVCFEPSRETLAKRLVPALGTDPRVTIENVGVGGANETRDFHNLSAYKSSSFLTPNDFFRVMPAESCQTDPVKVIRLDDYLSERGLDHVTLVKIDVQGFESEVLSGLGERITNVDWFYIEGSIHPLYDMEPTFCNVFKTLFDSGYYLTNLESNSFGTGVLRECNMLFGHRRVIKPRALTL